MIDWPTSPAPNGCTPSLIDYGGFLRGALGGETLRVNRLGSRFRLAVTMPPMPAEQGRSFVAKLLQGKREGVRMRVPLIGVQQSGGGAPDSNGAGPVYVSQSNQTGTQLRVQFSGVGFVFKAGWWVTLPRLGGFDLHMIANDAIQDINGQATLALVPALRHVQSFGTLLYMAAPFIEGFIDGDEIAWEMSLAHHIGIQFTVEEFA